MRTVATALVLIAGAAVILWYGSTLNNSWVLGGLIGGLAALLLSIPISLTLFSHLSRRHDERMELMDQMEEQEEGVMRLARDHDYPVLPSRRTYEVEAEGYTIREEDDWQEEEMERRRSSRRLAAPQAEGQRQNVARQAVNDATGLPAPRSQAYLPAPRQQTQHIQQNQPVQQTSELQQPKQGTTQRKDTKVLRSTSLNNISQHRMEALRMARKEAAQDADDDIEVSSTQFSRQERTGRTRQGSGSLRQSGQELQRTQGTSGSSRPASNPSRSRKDEASDTTSSKINRRQMYRASDEEDGSFQAPLRRGGQQEPETDYIDNQVSSRLTPLRRTPQTEQIVRRPRTKDLRYDQALPTADDETDDIFVNRPLVRRAPYMYEDDELRQRLAQQIDPPTVRRSSRQEAWQEDD